MLPEQPGCSGPVEALAKARRLRQEGKGQDSLPWLQAACADAEALAPEQAAEAWCLLAWEQRAQGEEGAAGHSLLRALHHQGDCQWALRGLDFHRFASEHLSELLPELERVVSQGHCLQPRAQLVLADWHHRVGDRRRAERFFRSLVGSQPETESEEAAAGEAAASERRPEALVIGAPKCGTTSLMAYLGAHPGVWTQPRKELHFFNNRWDWGPEWYADQFPPRRPGDPRVRLEGTPDYLQNPVVAERVKATLPNAKLIVVLREPVARALSWFHHQQRWGGLVGNPTEVISQELENLNALPAAALRNLGWRAPNCLAGSLYEKHLMSWTIHFSPENLLLLRFEDLRRNPRQVTRRTLAFLGLNPDDLPTDSRFPVLNSAPDPYPRLDSGLSQHCRQTLLAGAHQLWGQI